MHKGFLWCLGLAVLFQWWQPASAASSLQISGVLFDPITVPTLTVQQQTTPNDPLFNQQSYLSSISMPSAWNITTGNNLPVAIIDTGIDLNHPEFAGRLWVNNDEVPSNGVDDDHNGYVDDYNGFNFIQRNGNLADGHGHGTGIASIIAATANNGQGMAGINWSAPIMVLKALNSLGGGDFPTVTEALRYAVNNGAKVINMSFGSVDQDAGLADAINYATNLGVIVVAAVGNNHGQIFYPAAYPSVIAVSSISASNRLSSFSNYGVGVDLAAPGENVLMAGLGGTYITGSGSSFSSAEVAGVVSLLAGRYPNLTPAQADNILKSTADVLSGDVNGQYFGAGRVDAGAAMNYQPKGLKLASYSVSTSSAIANGIAQINVSGTIVNLVGQPQINLPINVALTNGSNIINGDLVSSGLPKSIGVTDGFGQFSFSVSSTIAGTKALTFTSGADTVELSTGLNVTFKPASSPRYTMKWLQQSPSVFMNLGETQALWVDVQNTGNMAWVSEGNLTGKGMIKLATDRPSDRDSSFYDNQSWLSKNRVATMQPSVVRPGETARFSFTIRASSLGPFKEYFRPVVEYVGWLNDLGIYWDIRVNNPNSFDSNTLSNQLTDTNPQHYSADIRGKTNNLTLAPNATAGVWFDLVNTGSAAWMPTGLDTSSTGAVRLGTTTPRDRTSKIYDSSWISPNRMIGVPVTVSPNGTIAFNVAIKAPSVVGTYQENFQLVSEYVGWFGPVFGWTITVK